MQGAASALLAAAYPPGVSLSDAQLMPESGGHQALQHSLDRCRSQGTSCLACDRFPGSALVLLADCFVPKPLQVIADYHPVGLVNVLFVEQVLQLVDPLLAGRPGKRGAALIAEGGPLRCGPAKYTRYELVTTYPKAALRTCGQHLGTTRGALVALTGRGGRIGLR